MSGCSVLVVDDEPLARRRVIRLLQMLTWVGNIHEASNIGEAEAQVLKGAPDILLLDIQMPGGTGFDLLARLKDNAPVVVFVTALDHHALRAFEASATDYITKPIEPGRFNLAMERARDAAAHQSRSEKLVELQHAFASLKRELQAQVRSAPEFWVKSKGEYLRIPSQDVIRFQADRDYVRLHVRGADYLYQENLTELEGRLDAAEYLRIHRGTIIRRGAIERIKPGQFGALIVVLSDGSEVRVGRTYTSTVRAALVP